MQDLEADPVWDLLARDAAAHPVRPSPWFATRVAAMGLASTQSSGFPWGRCLRWLLPLPLAACSALFVFSLWESHLASSERFEQNMELMAYSSSSDIVSP